MLMGDASTPALILLDLMMPEMDGWVFRREQQKVPWLMKIPVVLFSGHLDGGAATAGLDAVATMSKPMRLNDLVTLVDRLARCGEPN
jgi:CheY-like chemotaxis protein